MVADEFVFLIGAGVSIDAPSGIPPGGSILKRLIAYIANDDDTAQALSDYADPDTAWRHGRSRNDFLRFEALIERIADTEPRIFSALSKLETWAKPNAMHRHLASCAHAGAMVLTTNFDCRIERAALDGGPE